ncbi:MAG: DUF4349 domain-containing protein [Nanoarchaeota archaeon]
MTLKNQLSVVKENWLIALLLLVLVLLPLFSGFSGTTSFSQGLSKAYPAADMAMAESTSYYRNEGFAPEVAERKITKTATFSNEVKKGDFKEAETQLKAIITTTDSFLLSENVAEYDSGRRAYLQGYYQIKVETSKYEAVLSQLRKIGEVKQFSENLQDITEWHADLEVELAGEKERLLRYKEMYKEAATVNEKIELSDRIFNQERTIKYLEDALKNIDQRVDYSTIYLTLTEKQSGYANVVLVKFSELIGNLVNSFNDLLSLAFWAVPWLVIIVLAWLGYKKFKK